MCSRTLALSLAPLMFSLTTASAALAEPPARIPYVNRTTGECGLHITSSPRQERTPLDPGFGPIGLPWKADECRRLLDKVLAYPEATRAPSEDLLEAAGEPPCERLALSLPTSPEHACRALGYRYVGELPASIRSCYPNLAPLLGASCAPLIWIHLAGLSVLLACLGSLGYVILKRWAQRRQAMAAAAQGDAGPPAAGP